MTASTARRSTRRAAALSTTAVASITAGLPRAAYEFTPSTTREALIENLGLPADTTDEGVDDAIQLRLTTKYGLPITATNEEIEARMHEVRCAKFGRDPATTTEADLDAIVDARLKAAA